MRRDERTHPLHFLFEGLFVCIYRASCTQFYWVIYFFQYYKSRANRTKIQQKHATSKWNPVTINCVRRMDLRMWAFVCEPAFNLGGASLCHWARIFATSQIFFFGNSLVTSLLRCLEIFVGFTRAIWLFSVARDWRPSKTRTLEELTECELI